MIDFIGDGGFMMAGQELARSLAEGVGPIVLLFNNAMYGTIRMHQERRFFSRVVGTTLKNPDFVARAGAYRPSPSGLSPPKRSVPPSRKPRRRSAPR